MATNSRWDLIQPLKCSHC